MSEQRRPRKYPDGLRERAVRMVYEAERDCGSQWEAISSVARDSARILTTSSSTYPTCTHPRR